MHEKYEDKAKNIFEISKKNLSSKAEEVYKNKIMFFIEDQFNGNNHINTIVLGNAGVGKSTLINNILQIKGTEMEAKAGRGKSVTKEEKMYVSEKVPFLRVYDTPGLDFKLDIKTLFKIIKSIVEKNLNTNDPDKFINCIWYCVTGDRFQDEEKYFIKEIMRIYSSSYLPLIILFLKMGKYAADESKKAIVEIFKETKEEHLLKKAQFCRVLSEDLIEVTDKKKKKIIAKAEGFPELLKLTKNEIKNSVESALFENIQKRIKTESFEFNDNMNKLIDEVFQEDKLYLSYQKKLLDKIIQDKNEENEDSEEISNEEEKPEEEEAKKKEIEIENKYAKIDLNNFTSLMSEKLVDIYRILENNYNPKKELLFKQDIQKFLLDIKNNIIEWEKFNKFFEKIVQKKSKILSKKILEKQNEIDFQKKSKISQKGYQWSEICKDEIMKKYKEFALKELIKLSFAIFCHGSLLSIKQNVNNLFNEIINKKEVNNLLISKTKKCMNNIIDGIKYEFEEEEKKQKKGKEKKKKKKLKKRRKKKKKKRKRRRKKKRRNNLKIVKIKFEVIINK